MLTYKRVCAGFSVLTKHRGAIMDAENKKYIAFIEEFEVDEFGKPVASELPEDAAQNDAAQNEAAQNDAVQDDAAQEEAAAADASAALAAGAVAGAAVGAAALADDASKAKYVNKSFAQKMMLADEVIKDRYDELKNYALRFRRLKSRISKKFDSINQGRLQFVKLSVAGKTLKLFLNMDIGKTDPKFHCKDVRDKKTYETVPVLLRIKSGRAVKYAKILIDQCAETYGLKENKKFQEVDAIALIEESLQPKKKD